MIRLGRVPLVAVLLIGCAGETRDEATSLFGDGTMGPGGGPEGSSGADASTAADGSASTGAEGADSGGGVKLDVGAGDGTATAEGGDGVGCAKADFLFVIDNSGSMADEQDNLIASFPGFIDTIQQTLMAQDYHVMVVDTDAGGGGSSTISCINGDCTCSPSPGCCEQICNGLSDSCNGVPCGMLPGDECDRTLGAGKIFREDGMQCLDAPPRFMTDGDAMLGADFACVGEVGTFGDGNEQPMAAILAATSDAMGAVGACNEGFVRDDAILVVTFITDEEDIDKSPGDPAGWYADLVAVKNGDPAAIVVLGLMGDTTQPGAVCQPFDAEGINGAEDGVRLRQYVQMFGDQGVVGSVCEADYAPFFAQAVGIIDLACDDFEPPG
ncbi:MAG TPA: hypothetical protein VG755_11090 [Nannocystaceae bacterium]|nr:hypothetical protein [Nannocystaceae bacterium]